MQVTPVVYSFYWIDSFFPSPCKIQTSSFCVLAHRGRDISDWDLRMVIGAGIFDFESLILRANILLAYDFVWGSQIVR